MSAHLPSFLVIAIDMIGDIGASHRPICTLFEHDKAVELRDALDRERDEFYRRRAILEERWKVQRSQQSSQEATALAAVVALTPQQVASVLSSLTPQQTEGLQQLINEAEPQQPPPPVDGGVLLTGDSSWALNQDTLFWDQSNNRLGLGSFPPRSPSTDAERADVIALVQELGMTDTGGFKWLDRPGGPIYELWASSDDPSREGILIHDGTELVSFTMIP